MDRPRKDTSGRIAADIKRRRKAVGITQLQFARAVGTFQSQVARWETGRQVPSKRYLDKIDEALDLVMIGEASAE